MEESTIQQSGTKRDWALSQNAFQKLLDWLDEESDSSGERYLEMRRRLVVYFDRKNCLFPDELADETLNRVARRLEEEGTVTTDAPAHYCYIVARFVLLESLRQQKRQESLTNTSEVAVLDPGEEIDQKERRSRCLERCMEELDADGRQLIIGYYRGEQRTKIENRRAMAVRLGVTLNALTIRACRIREKLESCVRKCISDAS